jgi:hypothetical protein
MTVQSTRQAITRIITIQVLVLASLVGYLPLQKAQAYSGNGTTYVAGVSSGNTLANNNVGEVELSRNGNFIAFSTNATNLVAGYNDSSSNIYLRNLSTNVTSLVSTGEIPAGTEPDSINADNIAISGDGRYVSFTSCVNLDNAAPTGCAVFVRDTVSNTTTNITRTIDGQYSNGQTTGGTSISGDGRYVFYSSAASNIASQSDLDYCHTSNNCGFNLYKYDRQSGVTTRLTKETSGAVTSYDNFYPRVSQNGKYIAYVNNRYINTPSDAAPTYSVYVMNVDTGESSLVCQQPYQTDSGKYCSEKADVSNDGTVAYTQSDDIALTNGDSRAASKYLHTFNAQTGVSFTLNVTSRAGLNSPKISSDSRFIAYESWTPDTENGEGDQVYLYDSLLGTNTLLSKSSYGASSSGFHYQPSISDDGKVATFTGSQTNIVPGIDNATAVENQAVLYVHDAADFAQPPTPTTDTQAPTVVTLGFDTNPLAVNKTTKLKATVADNQSGVSKVEFYTGSDPGRGNGTSMAITAGVASYQIGPFSTAGRPTYFVRVMDSAGNWSETTPITLNVYNPATSYAAGYGTVTPNGATSDPGDNLPRLSGTQLKATFEYTVKYATAHSTMPSGQSVFTWGSGNCKKAKNNCFTVTTDTTTSPNALAWLIVPNNTTASIQGTATLSLRGQSLGTNYPIRINMIAKNGSVSSHYNLRIFDVGANPDTAAPRYQVSGDVRGGVIVLHK